MIDGPFRYGDIAYETAKKESPDLITLEISMPEKSGMQALKELQSDAATADIYVVIVTGVLDDLKSYR